MGKLMYGIAQSSLGKKTHVYNHPLCGQFMGKLTHGITQSSLGEKLKYGITHLGNFIWWNSGMKSPFWQLSHDRNN